MVGAETRLECFKKLTGVEILLELNADLMFQHCGKQWEVGDVSEIAQVMKGIGQEWEWLQQVKVRMEQNQSG